jgi:tricarballylate dehydrogenase
VYLYEKIFDVVVIGGGNAGLVSAISAIEHGAKSLLLIERAPKELRGGNSRYTRDIRYAHEDVDGFTTGIYSRDEMLNDILRVTGGRTNLELARIVVERSQELIQWMYRHGVPLVKAYRGALHLSRTNAFFIGGGRALIDTYYRYLSARKEVKVLYNTTVTDIIVDDGRVIGVKALMGSKEVVFKSNSVIVASGGFQANIGWLRQIWGGKADKFIVRGSRFDDGLLLRKLIELGAMPVGDPREGHMVAVDARAPRTDGGIISRVDAIPFGIVINRDCRRFYDEGEDEWPKRYAIWGKLVAEQPEAEAYVIFDSKVWGRFIPPAWPPYTASSLEELAVKLNLDPGRFVRVVKEFNDHVQPCRVDYERLDGCSTKGLDPPKSNWASRIDTPPFYAYKVVPGITFTYYGVAVDGDSRVLREDGKPFENLFAAGEIMMGNILSRGYLGGLGLAIGGVFGLIAGERAVTL